MMGGGKMMRGKMLRPDAGDSDSAEGLARTIIDNGDKAHVIRADVSKVEEIEKLCLLNSRLVSMQPISKTKILG